ncbi:DUF2799 domain-containing protein [Microbulbifer salipaludis]|uniref:DUF2799 domain-containing protein n=1 Tax=Microbulbifer salipaludis TaxID=187980 RepID=A0ABS3E560_9GAMM|nr:DUF2799 domain-containing protein [Microbulbifer salipaludis]MBN8430440.1 DUF2799 domain-containing protein [Microbulbifer salipaludis]
MKLWKLVTLLSIPAWLTVASGCAIISENECQAGLWYERGIEDGARGQTQATVYKIAQKCHEYGVRTDTAAWMRGYEEGIERYCTPENGFAVGRRGRNYEGVCTGPTADLFLANYERGLAVYQAEQQYAALVDRYESAERELYRVEEALDESESKEERRALRSQRRSLLREMRHLEAEMMHFGGFGAFNPLLFY